jgi:hypothetical protein
LPAFCPQIAKSFPAMALAASSPLFPECFFCSRSWLTGPGLNLPHRNIEILHSRSLRSLLDAPTSRIARAASSF